MANGRTAIDEPPGSAAGAGAWTEAAAALGGAVETAVNAHWPGDVLQRLFAAIDKGLLHLVAHLPPGVLREANPAGIGNALDPRSDVDPIAHQVAVGLLDHVAEMNADPEFDAFVLRDAGVALGRAALDRDGAAHRVDDAAELDDEAVAGALDHPAVMRPDRRIEKIASQRAQPRERAIFVRPGETAEADDVGGEDRGDFPGLGHGGARVRIAQDRRRLAIGTGCGERLSQRSRKRETPEAAE